MTLTEHYYTKFEEEKFYHIYNRSVDRKPLFNNEGNYEFFLKKFDAYLSPVSETYAYCLLGNHFHMLLRIPDLTTFKKLSNPPSKKSCHDLVSHQLRKFFQSYAMAFNKQHDRSGSLFQTPFKRVLVDSEEYLSQLVYYIHANPQLHGLVDDFRKWRWSSYRRIMMERPSKLRKEDVLDWFGGIQSYIEFHSINQKMISRNHFIFED